MALVECARWRRILLAMRVFEVVEVFEVLIIMLFQLSVGVD